MCATKPTPHASCSLLGLYKPCFFGVAFADLIFVRLVNFESCRLIGLFIFIYYILKHYCAFSRTLNNTVKYAYYQSHSLLFTAIYQIKFSGKLFRLRQSLLQYPLLYGLQKQIQPQKLMGRGKYHSLTCCGKRC